MTPEQLRATGLHEASHAAIAVWFGRRVECVWRARGGVLAGETIGHCLAPVGEQVEPSQIPICLAGYWAEGRDSWPPSWEAAKTEELEALGLVIETLDLSEEQYNRLVGLTAEIIASADFRRLRDAIARALDQCPRLDSEDIERLCRAANFPVPQPKEESAQC